MLAGTPKLLNTHQVLEELEEQLKEKNQESKRLAGTVFEMRKGGAQVSLLFSHSLPVLCVRRLPLAPCLHRQYVHPEMHVVGLYLCSHLRSHAISLLQGKLNVEERLQQLPDEIAGVFPFPPISGIRICVCVCIVRIGLYIITYTGCPSVQIHSFHKCVFTETHPHDTYTDIQQQMSEARQVRLSFAVNPPTVLGFCAIAALLHTEINSK